MLKRFYIFICFLFSSLPLAPGCKKGNVLYNFAFNLNGVAENGDNYQASYQYVAPSVLYEFAVEFYIGTVADSNYVQISFAGKNYIQPGTYYTGITNSGNTTCSFAYYKGGVYYPDISGLLNITLDDTVQHLIAGNFMFTANNSINYTDTINITSGAFVNVGYTIR